MKPSALVEALHALSGQRVPLHIWGACGVERVTFMVPSSKLKGTAQNALSSRSETVATTAKR
jgi:hypothetical protein